MRKRLTTSALVLALVVQATALRAAEPAAEGTSAPQARSSSRGGRIIRTSSRSRVNTADRLAHFQAQAVETPPVPAAPESMRSTAPPLEESYEPAPVNAGGGGLGGNCANGDCAGGGCDGSCGGSCDGGCGAGGGCDGGSCGMGLGMGMGLGLGGWGLGGWGLGGGCDSCSGGECEGGYEGCGGCGGGGCGSFLCTLVEPLQLTDMIVPPMAQANGWFLDGWIAQGFTGNPDSPDNNFNTPVTFNDRANEWQVNQVYLSAGKETGANCYWDFGGRVDLLYGSDYFFTESLGLELQQDGSPRWNSSGGPRFRVRRGNITEASLYGVSMPQAYAEVYAPIMQGMRFKLGHFYSILGYESVMAPENFFYSHSYSMQYGEPFTHTGALALYDFGPCWSMTAGFTRGWDTWENPDDEYGFLGGLTWNSPTKRTSVSASVHTGEEQGNSRTVYSVLMRHRIHRCWTYVLHHDWGVEKNAGVDGGDANWYSLVNYFYWAVRPRVDVGLRYEWFHDQDNARVLAFPSRFHEGADYHAWTLGLNFKACENLVLRPELRADLSEVEPFGQGGMYNNFTERAQFTAAFDVLMRF